MDIEKQLEVAAQSDHLVLIVFYACLLYTSRCVEETGITDTAVRERRSIRLLLYQQFACELFHHASLAVMFDESVMLFCRTFGERCKPCLLYTSRCV